jgi:hypothetical protein
VSIDTLVEDIHRMVEGGTGTTSVAFGVNSAKAFDDAMKSASTVRERKPNSLYFSEVGESCMRRLWYKVNMPGIGEKLAAATRIKFLYGHLLEEVVLQLARSAGHCVEDEQREVEYDVGNGYRIRGRIDAVVDGVVVDVKSVTKYSEQKFENGLVDDPFNYKGQLGGYSVALKNDKSGFLTIQKEMGHIKWWPQGSMRPDAFQEICENAVHAVTGTIPMMWVPPKPQSATSKNLKLDTKCSYCEYKQECWSHANDGAGLRTFIYSSGPVFLVDVVDVPKVVEVRDAAS